MKFTKEDIKVFQDNTYYMEPPVNIEYVPLSRLREVVNQLKSRIERRSEKYFDNMKDDDYYKMIRDSLILDHIDDLFGEVLE